MQIHLNAKLQAYSKAPYYNDWIRDVGSETLTNLSPEELVAYLRVKVQVGTDTYGQPVYEYKWYADKNTLLTSSKIDEHTKKLEELVQQFESQNKSITRIDLIATDKSTLKWTDYRGIQETISLPTTNPDNKTIRQVQTNDGGKVLSAMYKADNTTILITPEYETITDEYGTHQGLKTADVFKATALYTTFVDEELVKNNVLTSETICRTLYNLKMQIANLNSEYLIDPMPLTYVQKFVGNDDESLYFKDTIINHCLHNWIEKLNVESKDNLTVLYLGDGYLYKLSGGIWRKEAVERPIIGNLYTLGLVKSSEEIWKGKIESDGTFTINGLQETVESKITQINNDDGSYDLAYLQLKNNTQGYKIISDQVVNNSIVTRTIDGRIKCNTAIDMDDAINFNQLKSLLATYEDIEFIDTTIGGDN